MPLYEFRCRTCDTTFELRRPMSEASDPASCPDGHEDAVRLLSVFATAGASTGASPTSLPARPSGGGCCGGGCGCAH
jgi:putative FmdB family regulatory protein